MTKKRLGRGLAAIYGDDVVAEVENERREAEQAAQARAKAEEPKKTEAGPKGLVDALSKAGAAAKTNGAKESAKGRGTAKSTGAGSKKAGGSGNSKGSGAKAVEADDKGREVMVRIARIVPREGQPRQNFDDEGLEELADSIKQHGVIQPLIVQKKGDFYEIISGERRWRAAKLAGLKEIPVLIRDYGEQESAEISLIENVQREDLNPIEEALAYRRLMDEFGLKQEEIASRVAKNRSTVTNSLRLLKLAPEVQQLVLDGTLSGGHARALLGLRSAAKQTALAKKVAEKGLSVRETEAAVRRMAKEGGKKPDGSKTRREDAVDLAYEELAERLTSIVSSKVSIKRKNNEKGKIEIEYASQDELERIVDLMESVRP